MSSTTQSVSSEIMQKTSMKLINAIKQNDQEEVFRLLNPGTNFLENGIVNGVDLEHEGSPLYWAAAYGHVHFVTRLVEAGADVNKSDKNGKTPVWVAAQNGHANTIAVLREAGANVDAPNNDGETPIYIAAYNGRIDAIIALRQAGANMDTSDNSRATPVWVAAQNGYANTIAVLREAGANVDTPDMRGATPVWVAAQNRHAKTIVALKNAGANVDTSDNSGATPVYIAAENGYADTIAVLKNAGANVDTPNNDGETPIYIAAYNGQIDAIIALRDAGANVDTPDNDGKTPVYIAAENGHADAIIALKDVGANVDTPDNDSKTPVYIAAENGRIDAIIALKNAGANVDTPDIGGATPIWIAAQNGHAEAIIVLKNAGANVNTPDSDDKTPVWVAAQNGHSEAISALLEARADASILTEWGTALECARQGKKPEHLEVIRVLEEHFQKYPNGLKPVNSSVFIHVDNDNHLSDLKIKNFIEAIKQNNREEVFRLLDLFGKKIVDEVDAEREGSPLYWAAACDHAHFITPLVEAGADVNKPDKNGKTPIWIAAQNGHSATISVLLEAGADASIPTAWGAALWRARQGKKPGHLEVVRVLETHFQEYPHGVKPVRAFENLLIFSELENVMNLPSQADIQAYAQERGISLRIDKSGQPYDDESQKTQKQAEKEVENEEMSEVMAMSFIEAIKKNNREEVFRFLDLFGKRIVNEADAERQGSPLYWAATCGHDHFIMPLVKAGADVNKSDKNGKTPVFIAAQNGHAAAVSALLEAGVDASIPTQWGTALMRARQGKKPGHLEVVRVLEARYPNEIKRVMPPKKPLVFSKPAQIEKKVENEEMSEVPAMSFIEAIKKNNREEVFRLLDLFGKRIVNEADAERQGSPLYWAAVCGHVHFITPLVEAGADVNKADKYGMTPVYVSAYNGHAEIITALKVAGADVDIPDNNGKMPIHIAADRGNTKTIFILKVAGAAKVVTQLEASARFKQQYARLNTAAMLNQFDSVAGSALQTREFASISGNSSMYAKRQGKSLHIGKSG